MKTTISTTAALFIITTNLIAGTVNFREKDSTAIFASASVGIDISHISTGNGAFISHANSTNKADVLEEWIAARESWEEEGSGTDTGNSLIETINLGEWISERESWEQGSETQKNELTGMVSLEEWIAYRESWEKEGSGTSVTVMSGESDVLERWISDRDNWEQK